MVEEEVVRVVDDSQRAPAARFRKPQSDAASILFPRSVRPPLVFRGRGPTARSGGGQELTGGEPRRILAGINDGRIRKATRALAVLIAALLVAVLCAAASAAQTEQIVDGGFEDTTCPTSDVHSCSNPHWPVKYSAASPCLMPPCGAGPADGLGFFSFGNVEASEEDLEGSTRQTVAIPTAPAILSIDVERSAPTAEDVSFSLRANIDPQPAASPAGEYQYEALGSTYEQRTIDLSRFAGSSHVIEFFYVCDALYIGHTHCPVVNIDDVSLKTGTPDAAPPGGGASPPTPETTLTGKPKAKTTQSQAQFSFKSSIAGANFECSLDGRGFSSCIAPRIVHVGIGKHVFQVRAVASGQTDPTPSLYSWKVVKKRHQHRWHARH